MGVITEQILTKKQAIVWELMDSDTHQGGAAWIAVLLGIRPDEVVRIQLEAEKAISDAFHAPDDEPIPA